MSLYKGLDKNQYFPILTSSEGSVLLVHWALLIFFGLVASSSVLKSTEFWKLGTLERSNAPSKVGASLPFT
jgi:hypothetical protein